MIENPDETYERGYTVGWRDGYQQALMNIYVDLERMTDEDGSLNGGDTVEYIYNLLRIHGIGVEEPLTIELSSSIDIIDGELTGPRDALLLLARSIHDTIEGSDHDASP